MSPTGAAAEATPPDLRLLVAAVLCWAVTLAGIVFGWGTALVVAAVSVLAAAVFAVRARSVDRVRWWSGAAGIALVGCGYAVAIALRAHAVTATQSAIAGHVGGAHLTATLTDDPRPLPADTGAPGRVLVRARLDTVRFGNRTTRVHGAIVVFAPADGWRGLLPGQHVRFSGGVRPPSRADLTVATVQTADPPTRIGRPSWIQRAAGSIRSAFAARCHRVLAPNEAGLLPGLVLGDVSALPDRVRDQFTTAGLTHLTAVSGSNFAIVCGAVLLLVRPLGPRPAAVLTGVALVGFVILVRPSPSVLRAASMGAIALFALLLGRRKQALPALAATVLALLAWTPALAVDIGFALSVAATAALVLLAPTWTDWLTARGCPTGLAEALSIAAAAQVATAPLIAGISGRFSVVSLAANLAAAPAVAPASLLGAAGAVLAMVWPMGAELLIRLAGPAVWWLLRVADAAVRMPSASVPVVGGVAGGLLLTVGTVVAFGVVRSTRMRVALVVALAGFALVWIPSRWSPW
ncbi:ComEC/Rec2 family competence protein [Speluncibacter jeojiensis]|uniref:ComEC family competence protein n=1 Tax=Speluncibacter jeojiensis TaxID=2710754 RepID=A0A9X4RCN7_9ACTN|nr:ComEC family competence protein [Corynebacteriales bacterium D3-21]